MNSFVVIGIALLLAIICGKIMNRFNVPAVAGYIIAGLILGISGFHLVDANALDHLSFISDLALGIIAFNIGSELKFNVIKHLGKSIFIIALFEAMGAFLLVTGVMLLLGVDEPTALILGAVASATAPAATVMVLKECKAKGPLTSTLLGVVAIDDAICLMIYAVASSIAKVFVQHETITVYKVMGLPLKEIILSIAIGAVFGLILTLLEKGASSDTENLTFSAGIILLLTGLASVLCLSPLLCCMSLGIVVANFSKHERRVFRNIERFSPPVFAAFFLLAGARLDINLIPHIGIMGIAYFFVRIMGKMLGAHLGGAISNAPAEVRKNIGFGLLSQVGVAIGLAITVGKEFQGTQISSVIIAILLTTTIATEIIGPIFTKRAIFRAKEANA